MTSNNQFLSPQSSKPASGTSKPSLFSGRGRIFSLRPKPSTAEIYDKHAELINNSTRDSHKQRRFLFDPDALNSGAPINDLFKVNVKPVEDFNEIVDQDEERVQYIISHELVGKMLESVTFRGFIFFLIIVNSVLIGLQTDSQIADDYRLWFNIFDQIVLAIFSLEILLKWYFSFWLFWRDGWNIMDFLILFALLIGPQLTFVSSGRTLRILRVVRAFKSIRSVSAFAGLHMVVQAALRSLNELMNISFLLFIILSVFAVMGVTLFGSYIPDSWGNLPNALYSMFVCVTQDGWVDLLRQFQSKGAAINIAGSIFLFVSVLVGAFVFANLVIAAICTNLEKTIQEVKMEEKLEKLDKLANGYSDPNSRGDENNVDFISLSKFRHKVDFAKQTPMQKDDMKGLNAEKMENYLLLLSALEDNLAEYMDVRADLDKIYNVVQRLNVVGLRENQETSDDFEVDDEELEVISNLGPKVREKRSTASTYTMKSGGDILSQMMTLQDQGVLNVGSNAHSLGDVFRTVRRNSQV